MRSVQFDATKLYRTVAHRESPFPARPTRGPLMNGACFLTRLYVPSEKLNCFEFQLSLPGQFPQQLLAPHSTSRQLYTTRSHPVPSVSPFREPRQLRHIDVLEFGGCFISGHRRKQCLHFTANAAARPFRLSILDSQSQFAQNHICLRFRQSHFFDRHRVRSKYSVGRNLAQQFARLCLDVLASEERRQQPLHPVRTPSWSEPPVQFRGIHVVCVQPKLPAVLSSRSFGRRFLNAAGPRSIECIKFANRDTPPAVFPI